MSIYSNTNSYSEVFPIKGSKSVTEDFRLNLYFDVRFSDTQSYIKYLENIIIGVEKRLKVTEIIKSQELSLSSIYQHALLIPDKSKSAYQQCLEKYIQIISEKDKIIQETNREKEEILKQYEKSSKDLLGKARSEEKLMAELNSVKNELVKLKAENRSRAIMAKSLEELTETVQLKDTSIKELREILENQKQVYSDLIGAVEKTNLELVNENMNIAQLLGALQFDKKNLESKYNELNSRNLALESQAKDADSLSKLLEKNLTEKKFESSTEIIKSLQKQIADLNQKNSEIIQLFKQEKQELLKNCDSYLYDIDALKKKLNILELAVKRDPMLAKYSTNPKVSEQITTLSLDSSDIFSQFQAIHNKSLYLNSTIYTHSELLSQRLMEVSSQVVVYQEVITKIISAFRESRAENISLREKLFMAQTSLPLYLPVRGDPIDFAMAEYVNSLRNPLKVPFVREEHGVYLFGTRNLRVNNQFSKLAIVLHEGSIPIEDFVAKNSKAELEKLKQNQNLSLHNPRRNPGDLGEATYSKSSSLTSSNGSPAYSGSPNIPTLNASMLNARSTNNSFDVRVSTAEASFVSSSSPVKAHRGSFSGTGPMKRPLPIVKKK